MEFTFVSFICATLAFVTNGRAADEVFMNPEPEMLMDEELLPNRIKRQTVPTCTKGYEKVVKSTMCAVDSPKYIARSAGVSEADKVTILNTHNNFRAGVKPTASNMMKVYWDEELARVAEKWARQCYVGHDSHLKLSRRIPAYRRSSGQNSAFGQSNWKRAVTAWHNEVRIFKYGLDPSSYLGPGGWKQIGHYTQVVKDKVVLIGCGFAKCKTRWKRYYICNYITGQGNLKAPYKSGKSCGDCPGSCKGKLCDCGNVFCFNGGKLDINACKCSCKFPWTGKRCLQHPCGGLKCQKGGKLDVKNCKCKCKGPWSGRTCETINCKNARDPFYCGTQWPKSYCKKYAQTRNACTRMCGLCPAKTAGPSTTTAAPTTPKSTTIAAPTTPKSTTTAAPTTPKSTSTTAKTTTKTTTPFDCPEKLDPYYCGKWWPSNYCNKYRGVAVTCPIMCGLCPDLCNGITCENGGRLNVKTCTCSCPPLYGGETCSTVNCPKKLDPYYCGNWWPSSYCTKYGKVPSICPIMCKVCPELCGGKRCKNGGTLDVNTCTCSCPKLYTGHTCSKLKCPRRDQEPWYCGSSSGWPSSYCGKYRGVASTCPYMCGICR